MEWGAPAGRAHGCVGEADDNDEVAGRRRLGGARFNSRF
jgi:hypothetical protein